MKRNIFVFLIGLLSISFMQAQTEEPDNRKDAEMLFQKITPLGINLSAQFVSFKESGNRGMFNFGQSKILRTGFGLDYDFLQINKFNFKAGLQVSHMKYSRFFHLETANYESEEPHSLIPYKPSELFLNIPLTAEYINFLNEKTALAFHFGYELQYYRNNPIKEFSERIILPDGLISLRENSFDNNFTHGLNLGAGIYHQIGRKLMKFELNYHLHFSDLITQELQAVNLPEHPNVSAKNKWSGNHLDLKITFYLFNKK